MNLSLIALGGIPITLDRERIVLFKIEALAILIAKYGDDDEMYSRLYRAKRIPAKKKGEKDGVEAEIKDVEVLAFYLYAGLQADLHEGETLTLEQVRTFLCPYNFRAIGNAVVVALVNNTASPPLPGKAPAATASPAAAAGKTGPAKRSISRKRSDSPSPSSGGRRKSSGARR